MDEKPDFKNYTYAELLEAYENIDSNQWPKRSAELEGLIKDYEEQHNVSQAVVNIKENKHLRTSDVTFHGNGTEYFRIWIVNLLLTIVTLGIYSAWATVRNNRYFYSNTEIDGHRFSYLAQPLQILKGRVIGVALFASYFIVSSLNPALGALVALVLFLLTPILVVLSMRFRMKVTAYRNVRFNFKGSFGDAFVAFLFLPILGVLSFYLAMPWVIKRMNEYIYGNMYFGDKPFKTKLDTSVYYLASITSGFVAVLVGIIFAMFIFGGTELLADESSLSTMGVVGTMAMYLVIYLIAGTIWTFMIRNHIYNSTIIDHVATFKSSVTFSGLLKLRTINFLLLICTLGFAMPWVKVRTLTFFANATSVNIKAGSDSVIAQSSDAQSAIADEVSSVFDVDVAIG